MAVIMFSPEFAELVRAGKKRRTIRQREIKVGTPLSLREWSGGIAYEKGSTQVSILETKCIASSVVQIYRTKSSLVIKVGMVPLNGPERVSFIEKDGFSTMRDFENWFSSLYGLPFTGWLTEW